MSVPEQVAGAMQLVEGCQIDIPVAALQLLPGEGEGGQSTVEYARPPSRPPPGRAPGIAWPCRRRVVAGQNGLKVRSRCSGGCTSNASWPSAYSSR